MVSYRYKAIVLRWIDGDTVDLDVDLGFTVWSRQRFRLAGVDTPERGLLGWQNAIDFCNAYAPVGSKVEVDSMKTDKFGRYLGKVRADNRATTINEELLLAKLAVAYMTERTTK